MKNDLPQFNGFSRNTTDYPNIEGKLRTRPLYIDIDLTNTRSAALGSQLVLPLAGNSFYVDQKSNTGYATVHFQDNESNSCPVTVFSGFIARVPYHQLMIENVAQPGYTLRLIYGVDLDFVPTTGAGVSVNAAISVVDSISTSCQRISTNLAPAIGTIVNNIVPAASNPNGLTVRQISRVITAGAGGTIDSGIIAAAVAPVSLAGAANQILLLRGYNATANVQSQITVPMSRKIPPTWGVWAVDVVAVAAAVHQYDFSVELA